MLNQSTVTTQVGATRKTILASTQLQYSMSCMIGATGVQANEEGRKMVKAGTPLKGDLTARDTEFTVATEGKAVGVALHDVDVTSGTANGAVLVFGFIDKSKLDDAVVTMLEGVTLDKVTVVQ